MATARLKDKYIKEIMPALKEKFQYKSVMQVPKVVKISINRGIGNAVSDKKLVDTGVEFQRDILYADSGNKGAAGMIGHINDWNFRFLGAIKSLSALIIGAGFIPS